MYILPTPRYEICTKITHTQATLQWHRSVRPLFVLVPQPASVCVSDFLFCSKTHVLLLLLRFTGSRGESCSASSTLHLDAASFSFSSNFILRNAVLLFLWDPKFCVSFKQILFLFCHIMYISRVKLGLEWASFRIFY